jgi:hypothetical protein
MRTIKADTTDEQILNQIVVARQTMVKVATSLEPTDLRSLGKAMVDASQAVYNAETLASAQIHYRDILASDPASAPKYLMRIMTQGANDRWSGRGNDSERSAYDAVLAWINNQMYCDEFGE